MMIMNNTQRHITSNVTGGFSGIEPEEIQIPVPWGHISGKWWGPKGTKPIVALHGWQDNAGTFDELAPLISNCESLLCIDLPGHGFSSHLPPGIFYYVFWDGVMLLRRIVQHYKWQKVKLLGHSMGGAIAFLYAASFPNEVELLISLDIVSVSGTDIFRLTSTTSDHIDKYLKYDKESPDHDLPYNYDEIIKTVVDAYGGYITKKSGEILMKRGMQKAATSGMYIFTRDPRLKIFLPTLISFDVSKAYAKQLKCAYLNIQASRGLKPDRPGHYQEILEIIKTSAKRFEYHEVDGTHHVHLNEPEKVAPIISAFLASL